MVTGVGSLGLEVSVEGEVKLGDRARAFHLEASPASGANRVGLLPFDEAAVVEDVAARTSAYVGKVTQKIDANGAGGETTHDCGI